MAEEEPWGDQLSDTMMKKQNRNIHADLERISREVPSLTLFPSTAFSNASLRHNSTDLFEFFN